MNFGYLIIISKDKEVDYLQLAYLLALSIKNTQKEGYDKVALITDDIQAVKKLKSPWVFDRVIKWDKETYWNGRSFMDQLSPWDHTVCLDADMLFLRDYSHWIDYFIKNSELYVANKSYTYRNEIVTNDYYRKAFTRNNLPNLYSFYTFWKKDSQLAREFFTLNRYILRYPQEFSNLYLSNHQPKILGTDEIFSLAAKILDIQDDIAYNLDFPKVVHLKPMIQNWPWPANKISDHIGFYLNLQGQLKLGNFDQNHIIHYNEKSIITEEHVNILEEIAWNK